jgi:8-oxo-dGTP pyrophosphatase MutT (NUDIX family)
MNKTEKEERGIFFLDESRSKVCCAAGLLLWTVIDGRVKLLVIEEAPKGASSEQLVFSDPGGKVNKSDSDSVATAKREFVEELGIDIPPIEIPVEIYIPTSKYLLYVGRVDPLALPTLGKGKLVGAGEFCLRVHPRLSTVTSELMTIFRSRKN